MEKILVFGHKNPDTDTICSSIVMEIFNNKIGKETEAIRLGNINKETKFALNFAGVNEPKLLEKLEDRAKVVLVDHNEFSQSAYNIENAVIEMVVDHHRICDFRTSEPLYYRAEPVGCTSTIIYKMFIESGISIDRKEAILMLSAIISDTLLFKSPICTLEDEEAGKKLAQIANIDINKYGLDMLKAGTDTTDLSASQIINLDAKSINIGKLKTVIAQINTASIEDMLKRKEELEIAIKDEIKNKNLDLFLLAITDIIKNNSQVISLGESSKLVEKAYDTKLIDNTCLLKGIVSRKKQIIPVLERCI
ncbi:MAG: manganese-dependent inorganic pyrophosphatase [Clostridia bacterium]